MYNCLKMITLLYLFVLFINILSVAQSAVLDGFFNSKASLCEKHCHGNFTEVTDLQKACDEGCRLNAMIGLADDLKDTNKTVQHCISACSEAFSNESTLDACSLGCRSYLPIAESVNVQTLHLLTPVMSIYNMMAHRMRQFISSSWTVYVQEDADKMIILQTSPKVVESLEYSFSRDDVSYPQETKADWMDCISRQSGMPRWLLVVMLFGFVFALLWLCCATAVTSPNHYIASTKKKEMGYILVCEPNKEMKAPLIDYKDEEEAPPLPPKVSLI